LLSDWHQ